MYLFQNVSLYLKKRDALVPTTNLTFVTYNSKNVRFQISLISQWCLLSTNLPNEEIFEKCVSFVPDNLVKQLVIYVLEKNKNTNWISEITKRKPHWALKYITWIWPL